MSPLTSVQYLHNSNLFFSKKELSKILSFYSFGVSKGKWRDYAIFFGKTETSFYMFKHSLASPDCVLTKSNRSKKNNFIYNLKFHNSNRSKFNRIEDLLIQLKRREFKII